MNWPSVKAKGLGGAAPYRLEGQGGTSHRILERSGWPDILVAYHDRVTLGPTAVKVLAKKTGLTPLPGRRSAPPGCRRRGRSRRGNRRRPVGPEPACRRQ